VNHIGTILIVSLTLYALGMCIFLISENRKPQATWMLAFIFAPGIGVLIYILHDRLGAPPLNGFERFNLQSHHDATTSADLWQGSRV
jgi:hypothetical protein